MQLCDAKDLIEQDKDMSVAEKNRKIHETLEKKKKEIAQLHARIEHTTTKDEELKYQKEKSGRVAFEELERALSIAQKKEEVYKKLQLERDEKIK